MLLCKGKGCIWKRVCSRYVIGRGITQYHDCGDQWIDRCLNGSKFHRMHGVKDEECPPEGKEASV